MLMHSLKEAVASENWFEVKRILNAIAHDAFDTVLINDVLSAAFDAQQWDLVQQIITMYDENIFDDELNIGWVLWDAINAGQMNLVRSMVNLTRKNRFFQRYIINDATSLLAEKGQWDLVQTIMNRADYNLNNKLVNDIFIKGIKKGVRLDLSSRLKNNVYDLKQRLGVEKDSVDFYRGIDVYSCEARFNELNQINKSNNGVVTKLNSSTLNLVTLEEAFEKGVFSHFTFESASSNNFVFQSIACEAQNSGFTITLVKEVDKIHVICINQPDLIDSGVTVYTLEHNGTGQHFLELMEQVLRSNNRDEIRRFFSAQLNTQTNKELTSLFSKVDPKNKVRYLSTTWHFALANHYMKQNKDTTLFQALQNTKPIYKQMRVQDRVIAFHQLMLIADKNIREQCLKELVTKSSFAKLSYLDELFPRISEIELNSNLWESLLMITQSIPIKPWNLITEIIQRLDANSLHQPYINWAFSKAKEDAQWVLVREILKRPNTQDDIKIMIYEAIRKHQLTMTGDNRPWPSSSRSALKALAEKIDNIHKSMSLGLNCKLIGSVLGLEGDAFTGLTLALSLPFCHYRFNLLVEKTKIENAYLIQLNLVSIDDVREKKMLPHFGSQIALSYLAIECTWEEHAFTVTLFKENNDIHIIYVNRGQRMENVLFENKKNVLVYTVTNNDEGQQFLTQMGQALVSKKRATISEFFNQSTTLLKINQKLTNALTKSDQKVGNCGVANVNIIWHFALVDYCMRQKGLLLLDAYRETQALYKTMRIYDRVLYFHKLLAIPDEALRNEAIVQFYLKIIIKFEQVDYASVWVDSLTEAEVALLSVSPLHTGNASILITLAQISQSNQWDKIKSLVENLIKPSVENPVSNNGLNKEESQKSETYTINQSGMNSFFQNPVHQLDPNKNSLIDNSIKKI